MTTPDLMELPSSVPAPRAVIPLEYGIVQPRPWGKWIWWAVQFAAMLGIVAWSVPRGLELRKWAWDKTTDIHFSITMNSAIRWGHNANEIGLVKFYDHVLETLATDEDDEDFRAIPGALKMDYPPLRLIIISRWEAWTAKHFPPKYRRRVVSWQPQYEFTRPMLLLNNACELAGAAAMFLLVHYWLRRCRGAPVQPWLEPVRGCWPALLAALLVWFNPAVIFNAHCYPQWDVWILAPFLLAVYLGLLDFWLISGILIGVVAMGKGQILLVTPALAIWQLCLGRPGSVLRLTIGIMLSIALIASPWMVSTPVSYHWTIGVLVALAVLLPLFFFRKGSSKSLNLQGLAIPVRCIALTIQGLAIPISIGLLLRPWAPHPMVSLWTSLSAVVLVAAAWASMRYYWGWARRSLIVHLAVVEACIIVLVLWPWIKQPWPEHFGWIMLAGLVMIVAARFLPRRWAPTWFATGATGAVFACVPLFGTSMAWYTIGIVFPTHNWKLLYWCKAMNLGAILQENFGWEWHQNINLDDYLPKIPIWHVSADPVTFLAHPWISLLQSLQHPWIMPMRYLMVAAYAIALLLCGIAMAVHYRRKSPMFFFAMVAPWVLMFALLPQMQSRYLVWAAGFSAATAAFSLDGFMLYLLLAAISIIGTAVDMMQYSRSTPLSREWIPLLTPMFPDLAWATLLIAGIWLYLALSPGRRGRLTTDAHGLTQIKDDGSS